MGQFWGYASPVETDDELLETFGYTRCPVPRLSSEQRIIVDKRTHRIRFENESEHEVTIIIEPK